MKTTATLSVFGLGKLGLPFAVSWAARGFRVIGVDVRPEVVHAIAAHEVADAEPLVKSLIREAKPMLEVTGNAEDAVEKSDVSFVIVPTPSDATGGYSTQYVEEVLKPIGRVIGKKSSFHLVVIVSTILPGVSESVVRPVLERVSGKKCGVGFGICYNPEFIALGEVVHGLLEPDFVLIGESDALSGSILSGMYERFCKNKPPIMRMGLWNAELAKISLNVYVTMKISFANTLAALCERIPGGDVDIVSQAIGLDSRIGTKYLKGGLGYGGPCFPRDNRAFSYVAKHFGNNALLSQATDAINADSVTILAGKILKNLQGVEKPQIAMLGVTYKPNTFVVEESAALYIAKSLIDNGAEVKCYDPSGMDGAKRSLGASLQFAPDVSDCLQQADFCIIATPWREFVELEPSLFIKKMRHPTVLDCWRILDRSKFRADPRIRYLAVGLNNSAPW